jgi:hypothetical protein
MINASRKKILHSTVLFFSILITGSVCFGQTYSARATVDKHKVLLGEQFFLTIEVIGSPEGFVLPNLDTIPHFEILDKTDPEKKGNTYLQTYRLTSFDSGHWVIPAFRVTNQEATDTIHMDVVFTEGFDPKQDYHDIKDIIEVKPEGPINWFWWIIIGAALVLLVIIWLVVKRKKPVIKDASSEDAYKEALARLEELKKAHLPDRQFYSEVVDVFRLYVFRRKGILSLQKTTDDLVLQLSDIDLDKESFSALSQALRLADFVKFAKFQPADIEKPKTIDAIKQAIFRLEESVIVEKKKT